MRAPATYRRERRGGSGNRNLPGPGPVLGNRQGGWLVPSPVPGPYRRRTPESPGSPLPHTMPSLSRGHAGVAALALLGALAWVSPGAAQRIEGRITGDDGAAVEGALVGLYDGDGTQRAATLSDEGGFYRLDAPEPGEYVLGAERIGYTPFRSHLLAVGDRAEPYRIDLEMLRAPVPIAGLTVTAERREAIERQLRLLIGANPEALRNPPIPRDSILAHWERGRSLPEMLRWSNIGGLTVKKSEEGYCFELRQVCVPVYLNGMRMQPAWHDMLPLELAETVVVIARNESIRYEGGAILLYTAAWMR